jgi:hypothetical protein
MPLGTAGKVAGFAIGMALTVGGLIYAQDRPQPLQPECVSDEDRVNIRRLLLAAVDEAMLDHMKALFLGWIKDPSRQPERASAGLQASIVAYQRARADALKWNPKSCETGSYK